MPGLILPRKTISDCLMVLQFLHNFGNVLRLGLNSDMLTISNLQEGLLNIGDSMHNVQDMLVSMLSAAVCDPGVPAGHKVSACLVCSFCTIVDMEIPRQIQIHCYKYIPVLYIWDMSRCLFCRFKARCDHIRQKNIWVFV